MALAEILSKGLCVDFNCVSISELIQRCGAAQKLNFFFLTAALVSTHCSFLCQNSVHFGGKSTEAL